MSPEAESEPLLFHLLAWLEGGTRSAELDSLEQRDPGRFQRQLALARALLQSAEEARLAPLDRAARERALALLVAPTRPPLWRTLLARLVPLAAEPGFALREGDGKTAFQALYEVEGYDIDLMRAESGEILGQVLCPAGGPEFDGGRALLQVQRGEQVGLTLFADVEVGGTFRFGPVEAASVCLVLEGDGLDIRIEGIELPA